MNADILARQKRQRNAYKTQTYWESACSRMDLWDGNFTSGNPKKMPLFLHVQFLDDDHFYNHWTCYDDSAKLLGFIRHIYIPTAAYSYAHPDKPVATPFGNHAEFLASLPVPLRITTQGFMEAADNLWNVSDNRRTARIIKLCAALSDWHPAKDFGITIACYPGTRAIDAIIKKYYWDEDVFIEDVGMTFDQWDATCEGFKAHQKNSYFFLSLLKNRLLAVA